MKRLGMVLSGMALVVVGVCGIVRAAEPTTQPAAPTTRPTTRPAQLIFTGELIKIDDKSITINGGPLGVRERGQPMPTEPPKKVQETFTLAPETRIFFGQIVNERITDRGLIIRNAMPRGEPGTLADLKEGKNVMVNYDANKRAIMVSIMPPLVVYPATRPAQPARPAR